MDDLSPPFAEISEQTVVGQCMVYDYCIKEAANLLNIDDFYLARNRILYKIMLDLNADGVAPDVQLVGQRVIDRGLKDKIGGLEVLSGYIDAVCTGQNLSYHAKIIKEKAALRNLIWLSTDIKAEAYDSKDPQDFLEKSKASVVELANIHAEKRVSEGVTDGIGGIVGEILKGEPPRGMVQTGIRAIDGEYGGLSSNLLTVVAGRPSMGKSAFLLNIAINIGLRGQKVLYLTLEDAAGYQKRRLLARLAGVNLKRVMLNQPTGEESTRLIETQLMLENRKEPLFWIQDSGNTPEKILHSASTRKATTGLDVLMVDHLGYVREKGDAEYQITSNAVRRFAEMAKELEIPVVLAVQFNRKIENDKRTIPKLSDLRGSGHIEEDARIIWFVHRPKKDDENADPHEFNLFVAKASHGKPGKLNLWCDMSQIWIRDKTDSGLDYTDPHKELGY